MIQNNDKAGEILHLLRDNQMLIDKHYKAIEENLMEIKEQVILYAVLLDHLKNILGDAFIEIAAGELGLTPCRVHDDYNNYSRLIKKDISNKKLIDMLGILK